MAELLGPGSSPDDVRDALAADGLIFEDPEAGWQTADAYLSGNVKRKLATAQSAMVAEPRFQHNVDALQLVIPADIPPGQIEVRLGTHWIPPADVNRFLAVVLDAEEPRWSRNGCQFFNYVALSRAEATDPVYYVVSTLATPSKDLRNTETNPIRVRAHAVHSRWVRSARRER